MAARLGTGVCLLLVCAGCSGADEPATLNEPISACSAYVTGVVNVTYGTGAGFGHDRFPGVVYGPPRGGGSWAGSLDVLSLGDGGSIVVELGQAIVDGPGPDFIVFENAFNIGGDSAKPYADLATIEVSADGSVFHGFECAATSYPYGSCAGWHPVVANPDANAIDPLDPAAAGGDAFDLADLKIDEARFVRISDRPDMPGDFDLDAVGVVHGRCP